MLSWPVMVMCISGLENLSANCVRGSTDRNGKALVDWMTIFCTVGLEDMFNNQPKAYTSRTSALSSTAACSMSQNLRGGGFLGVEAKENRVVKALSLVVVEADETGVMRWMI